MESYCVWSSNQFLSDCITDHKLNTFYAFLHIFIITSLHLYALEIFYLLLIFFCKRRCVDYTSSQFLSSSCSVKKIMQVHFQVLQEDG